MPSDGATTTTVNKLHQNCGDIKSKTYRSTSYCSEVRRALAIIGLGKLTSIQSALVASSCSLERRRFRSKVKCNVFGEDVIKSETKGFGSKLVITDPLINFPINLLVFVELAASRQFLDYRLANK